MKTNRLIAGGVALALVAAIVGLAVAAGRDSDGNPAVLPVLGSGGAGAPESMAADASSGMRMAGRVEYRASGKLPALDGEADAWKVPAAEVTAAKVAELAEILGVGGEPQRTEFGWIVGNDTRRLDVQHVAGNPWSLHGGSSSSTGTMIAPAPDCAADACDQPMETQRPADLPSKAEAEQIGRRLLGELGVGDATIRIDDAILQWSVNAEPVIGGLPTIGLTTSLMIGPKGIVEYANGWLGEHTKGDRYPLIGTAAGIEKLGKDQMSILTVDPAMGAPQCESCPEAEPMIIDVTGVRLGLQLFSTYEEGADGYLVPSYFFSADDGGEFPVIAIAEEYLATTPSHGEDDPGTPAEPAPDPDAPTSSDSGECAGAGNDQLSASVCVTSAPAGKPVVVTVSAKGTMRDDCGSPTVEFGDEGEGMAVCAIGCESLPPEPIELERTFEHVYVEPGNYDLIVHFHGCGADSGTEQLTVPILVRVEG